MLFVPAPKPLIDGQEKDPSTNGEFASVAAIRKRIFPLGDAVRFFPGHGPGGTLGDERRTNPFAGDDAPRGRFM